ncbi:MULTISPECIES: hypothetical protein [unclassified Pseudomonas]|uniref:hypothetical protein n=1 Tax=unclassified Pseudomonas TaxID=196821 RepID=UPI00136A2CD6|nr:MULTISPECIES: hypothetical protein [unclassified Pseudomonas]MBD0703980.1 hypothetical protein [Pseudomonas sp. PSB1]MXR30889.1 hypothetical protein [Pseudomonas sp. PICF6]
MSNPVLVLHRRVKTLDQGILHCREIELQLTEDGRHLLLSRYLELYGHDQADACDIQNYRVPLASMIRWMVSHGERMSPLVR